MPPVNGEWGDCGGICVSDPGSNLTLTNSAVTGNTAITAGGGIELYNSRRRPPWLNDTITDNTVKKAASNTDPTYPDYGGGGIAVYNVGTTTANLTHPRTATITGNNVKAPPTGTVTAGESTSSTRRVQVSTTPIYAIDIDRFDHFRAIQATTIRGAAYALSQQHQHVDQRHDLRERGEPPGGGGIFQRRCCGQHGTFDTIVGNTATDTPQRWQPYEIQECRHGRTWARASSPVGSPAAAPRIFFVAAGTLHSAGCGRWMDEHQLRHFGSG